MKLLVLTISLYQDIELINFIGVLNASGKLEKVDYWNPDGESIVYGSNQIGQIKTKIDEVNVGNYDAIFIPGGKSCINLRTNSLALDLIKEFINLDKYIFAICDAPNALVDAKLLLDKKYVSYPIENIDKVSTNLRQKDKKVFVDGKYITGDSPYATIDFALEVIEQIYGQEIKKETFKKINGSY